MNTKHYTSIEQSKKLLELGLNPESADMYYMETSCNDYTIGVLRRMEKDMLLNQAEYYKMFPCWSVGALLELMPEIFEDENDGGCNPTLSKGYDTDMWHCLYRSTIYITDWYRSPTDAAFEMIVWLLENNYIKSNKNETNMQQC